MHVCLYPENPQEKFSGTTRLTYNNHLHVFRAHDQHSNTGIVLPCYQLDLIA